LPMAQIIFQFTFAGNCIVDVKLKAFKDQTIIEITQSNIPEDDSPNKTYD